MTNDLLQRAKELLIEVQTYKHLQGRHNQLSHGYRLSKTPSLAKARQYRQEGLLQDYLGRARERQGTKPKKQENRIDKNKPIGTPVSNALIVEGDDTASNKAREAIEAINSVHGDGNLPQIPIKVVQDADFNGEYEIDRFDGTPLNIKISSYNDHAELTTAHEIGHFIDFAEISDYPLKSGTERGLPEFEEWNNAINNSQAVANIRKMSNSPLDYSAEVEIYGKVQTVNPSGDYLRYTLTPRELWARSYAQYIAVRSGNKNMLNAIERQRKTPLYEDVQWSEEDFAPIADTIDKLFKAKGWIQ